MNTKRDKVQKEKDEIGENRERIGPKITEKMENNGKSASLLYRGKLVAQALPHSRPNTHTTILLDKVLNPPTTLSLV